MEFSVPQRINRQARRGGSRRDDRLPGARSNSVPVNSRTATLFSRTAAVLSESRRRVARHSRHVIVPSLGTFAGSRPFFEDSRPVFGNSHAAFDPADVSHGIPAVRSSSAPTHPRTDAVFLAVAPRVFALPPRRYGAPDRSSPVAAAYSPTAAADSQPAAVHPHMAATKEATAWHDFAADAQPDRSVRLFQVSIRTFRSRLPHHA
jgi:hypothetical protein